MKVFEVYFSDSNGNFQSFLMCAESKEKLLDEIQVSQMGWNVLSIGSLDYEIIKRY